MQKEFHYLKLSMRLKIKGYKCVRNEDIKVIEDFDLK